MLDLLNLIFSVCFYFHSHFYISFYCEPPPTTATLGNVSDPQAAQSIVGQNPYSVPNVSESTLWNPGIEEHAASMPLTDNPYQINNTTPVPLFSPVEIQGKSTTSEAPPVGSINNYRRGGLKRPVYAPIPGLTNPNQQLPATQFDLQKSFPNNPLSTFSSYERNTPQQFTIPNISPIPVPKDLFEGIDSSQINSPFLNPVSEPSVLPVSSEISNTNIPSSIMPIMAANDVQISSTLMFSDGKLPIESTSTLYRPPYHHWFYKKETEDRTIWEPFSMNDSLILESNFTSNDLTPEKDIPTDGGRYNVNILRRQRTSVYWTSKSSEVRRCSWFQKGHTDGKYTPFEENVATVLEEEYKAAVESNQWYKRINLPTGEAIMFHSADVFVLFSSSQIASGSDNLSDGQSRPRIVKRGVDEYNIDEGESEVIDHLLFMVHGIGPGCDLKFRSVEEVVDDFRSVALQLVRTHYRSSSETGVVHRIEVLPISWHSKLHSEDTDSQLKSITLESIPKLREFTNNTLLDILFYTSPYYGQKIISAVGNELNRIYSLFVQRNPKFKGQVSLAGHSLGSLILFDILSFQSAPPTEVEQFTDDNGVTSLVGTKPHPMNRKMSRRFSYVMGTSGTGQAEIKYPHLNFQPATFFSLGSPIGMFITIRGLDNLGEQFALPTCPGFFNIFHPYDPVAYRIESLINPRLANVKPVLIPHHKGRKRMHLELKDTMAKVGSDLKQKLVDSMKNTWNSFMGWSNNKPAIQPTISEEVDKVLEEFANKHSDLAEASLQNTEATGMNLGMLNKGRRVDYVLQEAPVEFFNEYIFALTSHVCYWDSEDTVLLVLKEIYSLLNVGPDSQIPQQTMTIERPLPLPRTPDPVLNSQVQMRVDATTPLQRDANVGPPPLSGFVTKS